MSPAKDSGFPYWNKASKIDSLRMHLISLSAINCVSMLNENSINSQDMHVANEHFFSLILSYLDLQSERTGSEGRASAGSSSSFLESHSNSPPLSIPTPD